MKNLSTIDLERLEKLSRISCSSEEEEDILQSLQKVIEYMELLQEVDTEGDSPTSHVLGPLMQNILRKDVEEKSLSREEFFENVPDVVAGMVKVPPVLKGEE